MKRCFVFSISIVLLLGAAAPVFSDSEEWELGLSWTPLFVSEEEAITEGDTDDTMLGFHFGYVWWHIAYASWDSIVIPPHLMQQWTGFYRPGFLNLYDVGIRLHIGPVVGFAEVGLNSLYIYKKYELDQQLEEGETLKRSMGANFRLGLGYHGGSWGITLAGTTVFPSFREMSETLKALGSDQTRSAAWQRIKEGMVPSLNIILYL